MSTLSIYDIVWGIVVATVDDLDLETTTMGELIAELVKAGSFLHITHSESVRAINKENNEIIRDNEKTLSSLGFKDGDTIQFVYLSVY